MKIGSLELSYPLGQYNVLVNHFTSRKSTAIEWCILELAKKAQNNDLYSDVTLSNMFEYVLKINDPDLLIKPCLISLDDLNAIKVNNLSDQISLDKIKLSDIRLTEVGERMQAKGLLPGENKEESVKFIYDLSSKALIHSTKGNYSNNPLGYAVEDIEEDLVFPLTDIRDYLEECKYKKTYQWLQETSDISNIELQASELKWRNAKNTIEVNDGVVIKFENLKDDDVVNKLVFTEEVQGSADNRIYVNISTLDIEDNISEMFLLKDLSEHLAYTVKNVIDHFASFNNKSQRSSKKKPPYIFIDKRYMDNSIDIKGSMLSVLFNAEEFKLTNEANKMVIELPGDISHSGCILLSEDINMFVGIAEFYNNFGNGQFRLGYKKKDSGLDGRTILSDVIDSYMDQDYRIISIGVVKSQEIVIEKLQLNISGLSSLKEKIVRMNDIKKICSDTFNKKIGNEILKAYKNVVYKDLLEGVDINSFDIVEDIYSKYKVVEGDINDFSVNNFVRDTILENIKYPKTQFEIAQIYNLLFAKEKGKRVNELRPLYSYQVIKSIYDNFNDDDEIGLANITSIESNYRNMKDCIKGIRSGLPGLDIKTNLNNRIILESIVENKKNINDIKNICLNWTNYIKALGDVVDIELLQQDCGLSEIFENMKKILDELSIFIEDESIKYNNVLVIDTCSVVENSEHLELLTKKNLVVIPSIVLKELDKHKIDEDEELRFKARQANRIIESLGKNIKIENANLDLVPKDLIDEEHFNADNNVLATAIKYIAKNVILVTEDINLRNKAKSQDINTMNFKGIYESNKPKENKKNKSDKNDKKAQQSNNGNKKKNKKSNKR